MKFFISWFYSRYISVGVILRSFCKLLRSFKWRLYLFNIHRIRSLSCITPSKNQTFHQGHPGPYLLPLLGRQVPCPPLSSKLDLNSWSPWPWLCLCLECSPISSCLAPASHHSGISKASTLWRAPPWPADHPRFRKVLLVIGIMSLLSRM